MNLRQPLRFLAGTVALWAVATLPALATLTFSPFVTTTDLSTALGNNATIGFAYAGNKFVGSVYFGTNNNQLYQTDLSGGGVTAFGTPIAGASGEIYVSSSLGLGGFGARDVFAGSEVAGTVYRFNNDGSGQVAFATGLSGGVRGIAFDPYGLYGYAMIVTTNAGNVYRVNNTGGVTWLANVGEDAEGLSFAPQAFGPYAKGTLMVASEGSGSLRAISPAGVVTFVASVGSAEMVNFVPLNLGISGNPLEGFYAANYASNIVKAGASDFLSYVGDIVVTGETTHGLTDVHWDGSGFVTTYIGSLPNQPEDGIFVTADILKPGCDVTGTCGSSVPEPMSLALFAVALVGLAFAHRAKFN